MNWSALLTILGTAVTAIAGALRRKPAEPPAPPPQPPGFDAIDRAEEERIARESAASVPPVVSPRAPMDAIVDSETAPTVRRVE